MKKFFSFLFLQILIFAFAQHNQDFKKVKSYYDQQEILINTSFKKEFEKEKSEERRALLLNDYEKFMKKFDSVRNSSYKLTLIKAKNTEQLNALKSNISIEKPNEDFSSAIFQAPQYPNGINALREQVSDLIYTETLTPVNITLKTEVTFVVERDGSITDIVANGENEEFNKQAEIAMYLLPEKFVKPAILNGNPVRYRFRLPLKINFE